MSTLHCLLSKAGEADMSPSADETEQSGSDEIWRSLLWIPPTSGEPRERGMLRLDDELAGLTEAAEVPAPKADTHGMKPKPASSVPGEALQLNML